MRGVQQRLKSRQHDERAERALHEDEQNEQRRGTEQVAPPPMVTQDVKRRREDRARHDQRAHAVREVNRDGRLHAGGMTCPNASGKSGIASPAPVCLIVAPSRICV